jgi:AmpE protein
MNFLIIVVAVLMVHQGEWIHHIQHDDWFDQWLNRLLHMVRQQPWLLLALVVGLPVLALALLMYFLADYWWLTFAINALVLFYAMGRGSWHEECDRWVKFFAEKDPLLLKQKIAAVNETSLDVTDDQIENTWLEARSNVLYQQLDGFYTVVFWFFIVGAPAALLYRLLQLYQQRQKTMVADAVVSEVNLLLWMMEWLPVRVMAMLFCLVGNFTTGFWVLKQIVFESVLSSVDTLARCADAALFLDGSVDDNAILDDELDDKKTRTAKIIERMESRALEQKTMGIMRGYSIELQALLKRSEWAFLVLIALIALV